MDSNLAQVLASAIPTLAVVLSALQINARLSDLARQLNRGFDDLEENWRAELRRFQERIDARLKHLDQAE